LIRPGEAVMASGPGIGPRPGMSPAPSPSPSSAFGTTQPLGGTSMGVIAGVASLSKQESLRLYNGRTRYDQWIFLAGQPRRLGRQTTPNVPGAGGGLGGHPNTRRRSAAPLR